MGWQPLLHLILSYLYSKKLQYEITAMLISLLERWSWSRRPNQPSYYPLCFFFLYVSLQQYTQPLFGLLHYQYIFLSNLYMKYFICQASHKVIHGFYIVFTNFTSFCIMAPWSICFDVQCLRSNTENYSWQNRIFVIL